jgi:hypothetical protein
MSDETNTESKNNGLAIKLAKSKFPADAVISYCKDAEGNKITSFGRQGSNRAIRFGMIREGMTVKEAYEAGVSSRDLARYAEKGIVTVA